jgi:peptide chain release factor 3
MATDLDGAPVFLAPSLFLLQYEQDRWPKIRFADVKDYQQRA